MRPCDAVSWPLFSLYTLRSPTLTCRGATFRYDSSPMLSVSATPSLLFEHLPSPGYSTEAKGKGFQFIVATGRLYDIELSVLEDALEYWMWTEDQPPIPQDRHFSVSDMRRGDWLGLRFRPWFQEWKDRTGPGREMIK